MFKCNEGAWVLLEDLLCEDYIWGDGYDYYGAQRPDPERSREIKRYRTGLIVDLTVAESRTRRKSTFQILGLRPKNQQERSSRTS